MAVGQDRPPRRRPRSAAWHVHFARVAPSGLQRGVGESVLQDRQPSNRGGLSPPTRTRPVVLAAFP